MKNDIKNTATSIDRMNTEYEQNYPPLDLEKILPDDLIGGHPEGRNDHMFTEVWRKGDPGNTVAITGPGTIFSSPTEYSVISRHHGPELYPTFEECIENIEKFFPEEIESHAYGGTSGKRFPYSVLKVYTPDQECPGEITDQYSLELITDKTIRFTASSIKDCLDQLETFLERR